MPSNPPENMPRITPYLLYEDLETAVDWLATTFGLSERFRMTGPEGRATHAEMALADGVVMMGHPGPDYRSPKRVGHVCQLVHVYVDDVVRANLASLDRPGFSIYNVGTGIETDVNTLFSYIAEAADYDGAPKHGPTAAGEQRRSCISSERMLEELSVAADTPLSEGIAATVAWFRQN